MAKNENPCKYCVAPERYLGCHDNCEKYIEWKNIIEKKKAIIREMQAEINLIRNYVRQRLEEQKRRHK